MADRAFIFDLDGTLWRSHEWYATVLGEVGGVEAADVLDRLAAGENLFRLAEAAGVSSARLVTACRRRTDSLVLYDGVREALEGLAQAGCRLGIVTSLARRIAEPALADLRLEAYFEATEFAARKPSPTPLLAALRRLGCEGNQRHYYVGDMPNDARCAAGAGISFAWASYGYGPRPVEEVEVLTEFADVVKLCG